MRAAPALLLCAACGASDPVLAPVIDVPAATSAAYPYTDLDSIELSLARAGDATPLSAAKFARGQALVLSGLDFGDNLVIHLSGRQSDIEVAYGRSCGFSVHQGQTLATPHVYLSRIVKWALGPAPRAPSRSHGDGYTTPDGSAVFVGGDGETSIDRFDPAAGAFTAVPAASAARDGAALAPISAGRALRIGGQTDPADPATLVSFFELLGPLASANQVQSFPGLQLVEHAAATLVDGSVVVIGGLKPDGAGGLQVTGATWSFRLGVADTPETPTLLGAALSVPRARHTLTRLGDEVGAAVLVVGGRDAAGQAVASAELYEPLREAYADFHPAMVRPRYDHRAVLLPDGSVLIVGGRDAAGVPVDTIELYLPRVGQFIAGGTLPAGAGRTNLTVTPLPDGRVLLVGGRDAGDAPVASTYIARLDPIDGTVDLSQTDSLSVARAGHSAAILCDGTILVVGGGPAAGSERYNPPSAERR